jgi:hypothetical protein
MNFSNKTLRNTLRIIHLAIAGLVGAYFYSPLGDVEWFANLLRVSVMPVFVITGLSMWQMPLITKLLKRQSLSVQQDT